MNSDSKSAVNANQTIPPETKKRSTLLRVAKILVAIIATGIFAGWIWHQYNFPYGESHCCILNLGLALRLYADDHGGHFPVGDDTPEASLSLLYSNYLDAYTLRGKSVPLETVQKALKQTGKLDPTSCGWHYVEGLTEADDPQIALIWDKVGLGHNGQRLRSGGRELILVDGSRTLVSVAEWPAFLEKQKQLVANRDSSSVAAVPGLTAKILLPTGQVLDHYDSTYELVTSDKSENSSGHGTESGNGLPLRWYRYVPDGKITLTLTLPNEKLRSKPVSFEVKNGRASPSSITFEMEKY